MALERPIVPGGTIMMPETATVSTAGLGDKVGP